MYPMYSCLNSSDFVAALSALILACIPSRILSRGGVSTAPAVAVLSGEGRPDLGVTAYFHALIDQIILHWTIPT